MICGDSMAFEDRGSLKHFSFILFFIIVVGTPKKNLLHIV